MMFIVIVKSNCSVANLWRQLAAGTCFAKVAPIITLCYIYDKPMKYFNDWLLL